MEADLFDVRFTEHWTKIIFKPGDVLEKIKDLDDPESKVYRAVEVAEMQCKDNPSRCLMGLFFSDGLTNHDWVRLCSPT